MRVGRCNILVVMPSQSSDVWKHFLKNGESINCKYCPTVYSGSTGTSNLWGHVRNHHSNQLPSSTSSSQRPVTIYARSKLSKSKDVEINEAIATWMAYDGRPFHAVRGEGFKKMCNALNAEYKVKDEQTYKALVRAQYKKLKPVVKKHLQSAAYVGITCDMWTSVAKHAYITVTAHWLNKDTFQLMNACIGIEELDVEHSGDNIAVSLLDLTERFGISSKVVLVVADNASNIDVAVDLIDGWDKIGCTSHSIQLSIKLGMKKVPTVNAMFTASKKLVKHFSKSTKKTNLYRDKQKDAGVARVKTLISFLKIRWNSAYLLFDRLLELKEYVIAVLRDTGALHLNLSSHQWDLCIVVTALLKKFYTAKVLMSVNNGYVSLPLVYPVIFSLKKSLIINDNVDIGPMQQMKRIMAEKINEMFFYEEWWLSNPTIASVFDPRFKRIMFIDAQHREATYRKTKDYLYKLHREKEAGQQPPGDDVPIPSDSQPEPNMFAEFAGEELDSQEDMFALDDDDPTQGPSSRPAAPQDIKSKIDREWDRYILEAALPHEANALEWWQKNHARFPLLMEGVLSLFAVPASNVPAESTHSSAGFIVNKYRSSLHLDNVSMLVFMRQNRHLKEDSPVCVIQIED